MLADADLLFEILNTFRMNKLRTFLTGFTVSWGIFMLIILLGSGNGIENGTKREFERDAVNSIRIWGGKTSISYKGYKPGRNIRLENEDYDRIKRSVEGLEYITSRYNIWSDSTISYKDEFGVFTIIGCHPDYLFLEKINVIEGRMINDIDFEKCRKVVVIGIKVRNHLFKNQPAIGKFIDINKMPFKVVGVFTDDMDERQERVVLTAISTAQKIFNAQNRVNSIMFTTRETTLEATKSVEAETKMLLARKYQFSVDDEKAIHVWGNFELYMKYMNLFKNIRIFIWVIGIGTIIAGIVGVSNIMVISVKERTKEIGVRKAVGAPPNSIVAQILMESVCITSFSGYVGLVGGVGCVELMANYLPKIPFFENPTVDLRIAITAVLLLVVTGLISGYIPAKRASGVRPIEALKDE